MELRADFRGLLRGSRLIIGALHRASFFQRTSRNNNGRLALHTHCRPVSKNLA